MSTADELNNIGYSLLNQKRFAEAIPYLSKAVDLFDALRIRDGEYQALGNLVDALRGLQEWESAAMHFHRELILLMHLQRAKGEGLGHYTFRDRVNDKVFLHLPDGIYPLIEIVRASHLDKLKQWEYHSVGFRKHASLLNVTWNEYGVWSPDPYRWFSHIYPDDFDMR